MHMHKRRNALATAIAGAAVMVTLIAAPAFAARAVEYVGHVNGVGSPPGHNTLFVDRSGGKARVADFLANCGEFSSAWVALRNNSFSFNKTFANGYGLKASVHLTANVASGTIEAWSPHHKCDTGPRAFSVKRGP